MAASSPRLVPDALKIIALALGSIVLLLFLWRGRALFLTIFLGIIAGLALARAADWLEQHRIRRGLGAPLTMLVIVGALVGLIAAVTPTVRKQTKDLTRELPKAFASLEKRFGLSAGTLAGAIQQQPQQKQQPQQQQPQQPQAQQQQGQQPQAKGQQATGGLRSLLQRESRSIGRFLFPAISSTFEAVFALLILFFVAMYIGISPHTYRDGILHLVPHDKRGKAEEVLSRVDETLRGWLVARLIAMVIIGAVTAGALMLLKVKGALALGLIAGLLEILPFYGPFIAAIPGVGIALADSPQKGIYVALLYIAIQQLEGHVLTPLILKRRLEIPPVLTIVTVSAFGIVFGVIGMLAAEPLLAMTLVAVKLLYVRDVVGDDVE